MSTRRDLSPEQKQAAWDRYAVVGSWAKVAQELGMGVTTLRDKMGVTPQKRYSSTRQAPHLVVSSSAKKRNRALYDPHRDGDPIYDNEANAMVLGDPPRGRRELLEANAERTRPPETHPNARPWRL